MSIEGAMAEAEVHAHRAALEPARSAALDRQVAAERTMMRAVIHGILIAVPFTLRSPSRSSRLRSATRRPGTSGLVSARESARTHPTSSAPSRGVMLTSHLLDELDEEDLHADHST